MDIRVFINNTFSLTQMNSTKLSSEGLPKSHSVHFKKALREPIFPTQSMSMKDFIVDVAVPDNVHVSFLEVANDGERKLFVPVRVGDCLYDVQNRAFDVNIFNHKTPVVHPHVLRDLYSILDRDIFRTDFSISSLIHRNVNGVILLCDIQNFMNKMAPSAMMASLGMFCHLLAQDIGTKVDFVPLHGYMYMLVQDKYYTKLCVLDEWESYLTVPLVEQHMYEPEVALSDDDLIETRTIGDRIYEGTATQLRSLGASTADGIYRAYESTTTYIFDSIKNGIRGLIDGIYTGVMESTAFTEIRTSLCDAADKISKVLILVVTTYIVYKVITLDLLSDGVKKALIPMLYGLSSGLVTYTMCQTLNWMLFGHTGTIEVVRQNDGKVNPVSMLAAFLGLGVISVLNTDDKGNSLTINNHVAKLSKVASMVLVTGTVLNEVDISKWISLLPQCIASWFDVDVTPDPKTTVSYLMEDIAQTRRAVDPKKRASVIAYINSVDRLLGFLRLHRGMYKDTENIWTSIRNIVKDVEMFKTFFGRGTINRRRAFWIFIWSATPGTGKSVLADTIAQLINHHIYNGSFDKDDLVYPRNETKYWDRYYHQPIVLVDDLGSKRPSDITQELIHLCSDVPYTLNMASLDNPIVGQKGTCFSSEVVITTTNTFNPAQNENSIENKDAWMSRRNLCIEPLFVNPTQDKLLSPADYKKLYFLDDRMDMDKAFGHFAGTMSRVDFDHTLPMMRFRLYSNSRRTVPSAPQMKYCYELNDLLPIILNKFKTFREKPLATDHKDPAKFRFRYGPNGFGKVVGRSQPLKVPKIVMQNANTDDDKPEDDEVEIKYESSEDESYHDSYDGPTITTTQSIFPDTDPEIVYDGNLPPVFDEWGVPEDDKGKDNWGKYNPTLSAEEAADRMIAGLQRPDPVDGTPFTQGICQAAQPIAQEYVTPLYKNIKFVLKLVAAAGAMLAVSKVAYDIYTAFNTEALDQHSAHNEKNIKSRRAQVVQKAAQCENEVKAFLYKNTGSVCVEYQGAYTFKGSCFGYGNYILFPRHFIIRDSKYLPLGTEILVRMGSSEPVSIRFNKDECKFFLNDDGSCKDLVAYRTRQMTFKSRKDKCPRRSIMVRSSVQNLCVGGYQYCEQVGGNVYVYTQARAPQLVSNKYEFGENDAKVSYQTQWDIKANLTRGDCGMLLYDPQNPTTPILGMYTHTYSGSTQRCEPITSEMLESLNVSQNSALYDIDKLVDFERDPKIGIEQGVSSYEGYRDPVRLSEKSGFLPSPLVGQISFAKEPVKFPSILSHKDKRCPKGITPLTKAGSKYKEVMKPFNEEAMRYAANFQYFRWSHFKPKVTTKIRSWSSGLTGIHGIPEFKQLSLSTAPGSSHIAFRPPGEIGKGWMFGRDEDQKIYLTDKRAIARVVSILTEVLYCKKVDFLFSMSLKSELLKVKKIVEANTRGFSISDFEYVVICKMFFMDLAKFMTDHHDQMPYAIGVTVEGSDFDRVIKNATKYGRSGFDGDAAEWDGRASAQAGTYAVENYSQWYIDQVKDQDLEHKFDDDFFSDPIISQAIDKNHFLAFVRDMGFEEWIKKVHMNLMEQCLFSHQHIYDAVIRTKGGIPSGHFLTAVLNSHINENQCNCAIVEISREIRKLTPTYEELSKVGELYYGDDNIILPSGNLSFITGDHFKRYFADHNMVYTPADKTENFGENRDITCMEFLKRDIYETNEGKFRGRMQMSTINSLLNWYQISKVSGLSDNDTMFLRWQDALKYLYFYEDETLFDEVREKCNTYFTAEGYPYMLPDRGGIWTQFFEENFDSEVEQHSHVDNSNYGAKLTHNVLTNEVGPTYKTAVVKRREPEGKIESEPIEYSKVVGKWYQVDTYDWTTTQVASDIIQSWRVPDQLITNQQLRQPFTNMKYWRGDVEVKFQINGTRFHQGLLVAAFLPMGELGTPKLNSVMEMTQIQHGFTQPQENATLTLKIPFRHCVNYIDTDKPTLIEGNIGYVRLMVASPLKASTNASTTIPVTVSVRLNSSEFHLQKPLVLQNGGSSSKSSKGDTVINYNYYMEGGGNTVQNETEGDQYDQEATQSTDVSPDLSYGSTNLDSINIGIQPYPIVNRSFPVINNSNNVFMNDRFTLYPQELAPTKKSHFNVDQDEMDINYIVEKPVYNTTVQWSTTDAKGTLLRSGQICPAMWSVNYRSITASPSNPYGEIPYTDVITSLFKFWRGTICTHIKIVASPFATGRLLFTPMYGDYTESASLAEADSQAYEMIDLGENKREFNFEWNFPSFMERKYCTNTHMSKITNDFRDLYSLGSFYLYVQAPYTVGEGIPLDCEILMFHYIKDAKFSFFQPGSVLPNTQDIFTVTQPAVEPVVQNAGVESAAPAADNAESELDTHLLGNGPSVPTLTSGLKATRNLKDILKKFVSLPSTETTVDSDVEWVDIGRIYELSGLAMIFGLYMWRRGGTRVILGQSGGYGVRNLTFYPTIRGTPATAIADNSTQPYNGRLLNSDQAFIQAESSFVVPYNFLLNLTYHSDDNQSTEVFFNNPVNSSNLQPQFFTEGVFSYNWSIDPTTNFFRYIREWTFAGADDIRFGGLVGYSRCTVYDLDANI